MKKTFTLLLGVYIFAALKAQLPVSQLPQNKKALLEQYTGKTCQFCPDGSKIAANMKAADPDNVFLISVHAGSFASGTPNYRTTFGEQLANQTGLTGYPSGTINRYVFTGTNPALNRGDWATRAGQIKQQSAFVNIAMEAEVDIQTNELIVNVEYFYTADAPNSSNFLHVALTQSGILGPQTGAATWYPENIDPVSGLYYHNNMLRHLLTGLNGQVINSVDSGSTATLTFTYELPEKIGDVDIDFSNLNVVAFISETSGRNVVNATEYKPVLTNLPYDLEAEFIRIDAPDQNCEGIIQPKVAIRNMGNETITNISFQYSVNNGTTYNFNWTNGNILPGYTSTIEFPFIGYAVQNTNELDIAITSVNGQNDEDLTNNSFSKTITSVNEHQINSITVEITPDQWGSEISWFLFDKDENIVQSVASGGYSDNDQTLKTYNITLPFYDCYRFELRDNYGDGMTGVANTNVKLKNSSGTVLHQIDGDSYSSFAEYKFATLDASGNGNGNGDGSSVNPTSIKDVELVNLFNVFPNPAQDLLNVQLTTKGAKELTVELIDIMGRKLAVKETVNGKASFAVSNYSKGIYFVNVVDNGASVATSRVVIAR